MLRFILMVMLLLVILKVSQEDPYLGFGIYLTLSVGFMLFTVNEIECDPSKSLMSAKVIKIDDYDDNFVYDDLLYDNYVKSKLDRRNKYLSTRSSTRSFTSSTLNFGSSGDDTSTCSSCYSGKKKGKYYIVNHR
ncbi:hypothetical protein YASMINEVIRUS_1388 [Yasminevirus sp. GU-2018]|uniref:Uncharacterized protein n=1 Tax=Yasminevirus sp. GU-2018 TaxID=2420051 RepID=A0A5K0UC46_9VIRU|nr:hypothetical protein YASMINEVIRUS_1388 [Yasminevirus sp. GU-2018]